MHTSIAVNLLILASFKYYDFFAESATSLLTFLGVGAEPAVLGLVLPVGISFYTFQSMAYTIDVYRNEIEPASNPFDFALYVSFFPQLVAGPIERASALLPQIQKPVSFSMRRLEGAVFLLVWGLYKKLVVADNLAPIVSRCLDGEATNLAALFVGTLAFSFQIYCDFSGYTDMARGSARLLGFRLRENFDQPYFAVSPSDFWRRWHISLSTWLRDYLYIPLGGSRGSTLFTCRNLMITMLLGGLWHGAAWNFVLWGAYHGTILVAWRLIEGHERSAPSMSLLERGPRVVIMFFFTLVGWAIFRAQSGAQLLAFAAALTQVGGPFQCSSSETRSF